MSLPVGYDRAWAGCSWTASSEGCRKAEVEQVIAVIADTGDPASEALHKSSGFIEVGRLSNVGFKRGQWIDTVLMQLSLESGAS